MTEKEMSEVKMKRTWKTPDGFVTHEKEVVVKNTNLKKAETVARSIWKKEMK